MEVPACPRCEAVNKPESLRCRRCGTKLRESDREDQETQPVLLERVMSGEIFSAILGSSSDGGSPAASTAEAVGEVTEEEGEPSASVGDREFLEKATELDDIRRMLLEYEARLDRRERELKIIARRLQVSIPLKAGTPVTEAIREGTPEAFPRLDQTESGVEGVGEKLVLWEEGLRMWEGALSARERKLRRVLHKLFPSEIVETALDGDAPGSDSSAASAPEDTHWMPDKVASVDALLEDTLDGTLPLPSDIEWSPEDLAEEDPELLVPAMEVAVNRPKRVRTFVLGLDSALGGGIPEGHIVLLVGAPGTLKSTLGYWILHNNAVNDSIPGLYVTLEQSLESLRRHMGSFGMRPSDDGMVSVLDLGYFQKKGVDYGESWLKPFLRNLEVLKRKKDIGLVVIDSLNALEVLAGFQDRRMGLFRLFESLRDLGLTVLLIVERGDFLVDGNVLQAAHTEDFLSDGVFHLRVHMISDVETQRRIRCMKMRGVEHEDSYLTLLWDEGGFNATKAMSI